MVMRTLAGLMGAVLCVSQWSMAVVPWTEPQDPPAVPPKTPGELRDEQLAISGRYARFERMLMQMADIMARQDPERADLLRRALGKGREDLLKEDIEKAVELLSAGDLGAASEKQAEVMESLQSLLKLMQSEDRRSSVEKERERLNGLLKDVKTVIAEQRSTRAATQNSPAPSSAAPGQQRAIEGTDKLLQEIRENDGKATDSEPTPEENAPGEGQQKSSDTPADSQEKQGDSSAENMPKSEQKKGDSSSNDAGKSGSEPSEAEQKGAAGKPGDEKSKAGKSGQSGDEKQKGAGKSDDRPEPTKDPEGKEKSSGGGDQKSGSKSDGKSGSKSPGSAGKQSGSKSKKAGGEPAGKSSGNSPSKQQQTPGKDELERAKEQMEEALEALKQQQRQEALKAEDQAMEELQSAVEKLEEELRQLREEEKEMILASLEARFQRMLLLETQIHEGTLALAATPQKDWLDLSYSRCRELAQQQTELARECTQTVTLLREDGSSVAILLAVEDIEADMQSVSGWLQESSVTELTQSVQKDILEALKQLIETTQKEMQDMKNPNRQQSTQSQGAKKQSRLVELMAEIKVLKNMQLQVNRRTKQVDELIPNAEASNRDSLLKQIRELSARQQKLIETTKELAKQAEGP
jgi:hypothetical protein